MDTVRGRILFVDTDTGADTVVLILFDGKNVAADTNSDTLAADTDTGAWH